MASTNNPAMAAGEMSVAATGSFFDKIVGDGFAQVGKIISIRDNKMSTNPNCRQTVGVVEYDP